jgi:hypothetical protein
VADPAVADPGVGPTVETDTEPGRRGSLTIADRALTRTAEQVARGVPGVAPDERGYPKVSWQRAGTRSRVDLELAITWPASAAGVAAQVQSTVGRELTRIAGQDVDSVTVAVSDVVRPPRAAAAPRVR